MITKSKFLPLNVFISGLSLNGFIREWFVTFYIVSVAIFLFTATCLAQTPITCGIPITDSISTANEKDNYTFTASAGDRVLIRALRTTDSLDPCLVLYDSTGKQIAVNCPSFCDGTLAVIETTLSPGGTYTITVSDCGENETGNYVLKLKKNNYSCPEIVVPAPGDGGKIITAAGSTVLITWTAPEGISSFEIWFSTDGCATFSTLIATVPGDTRAFEWTVPAELATGNGCIRIIGKDATGNIVYDKNSDAFLVLESVIETTRTYEYDKLNRLTKIASEDGSEITYTYDEVGNRLTLTGIPPNTTTTTTTPTTTTSTITTIPTTTTTTSTTSTTSTTTTTSSTTTTTLPSKICRTCPPAFSVRQGRKACKTFKVWNCGNGTLTWTVSEDCNWLTLSPLNGTSTREKDTVRACVNTTGMAKGEYQCTVTIAGEGASNAPQTCVIKLKVK